MQEFFMDYGLWLLVGLLVVIALVFLLSGKRKADEPIEPSVAPTPVQPAPIEPVPAPTPFVDPIIAAPVTPAPIVVEPVAPVAPPAPIPQPAPIAPEPEPMPAPATAASPAPATDESDDLLRLKGVGPKLKALLTDLGVTRFAQIADWSDADIAAIDTRLGTFKGRPVRDQWVDQAKYLAAGDIAGFEAKYGKL
ncbi:hypothetical protein U5A82_20390 [Sphingobium sp. CR2-8]|uniref:hypothetical protein n=1 Tax=Sphingobium sp. CR2-8 TaxID=1306534 RepID=UPI002DBE11DE|nr:hypothetical protein [Sphingobium sp. CR2-8]MEC3912744.1 hypothetical protein [Sphingobium sp. CR2-8]